MALDSRFVVASDLQSLFRDKDTGLPLRNGVIYFFEDEARSIPKDVYKITGTPPNYSYVSIGSVVTLTASGTFSDNENPANDIVPYYFPYVGTPDDDSTVVQLYFVQVYSEGGTATGVLQFTREGWPNVANAESTSQNLTNYIPNGQFKIHIDIPADNSVNPPLVAGEIRQAITDLSQGGWSFERPNASVAKDIVLFEEFGSFVSNPTASPTFFIKIENQSPAAGDGYKDLRIKFDDVNKFASDTEKYTFAFWGESNSGSVNVSLILIKNYQDGNPPEEFPLANFVVTNSFAVIQKSGFPFGDNEGKTIGDGSYLQLALRFPTGSLFSVNLTDFILTPGSNAVTEFPQTTDREFATNAVTPAIPAYDSSDLYLPLVLTPSGMGYSHADIGKVLPAFYTTPNIGELLCDGTRYETAAFSSDGIPYSRLFNVLFDTTLNTPKFGTGGQFFTAYSNSVPSQDIICTNFPGSTTAISDGSTPTNFIFNTLATGSDYGINAHLSSGGSLFAIDDFPGVPLAAPTAGTSGFTIAIVKKVEISGAKAATRVFTTNATGLAGKYFTIASTTGSFYVWFKVDGAGSDPTPGGIGIQVDLFSAYVSETVALCIAEALSGHQVSTVNFLGASGITAGSFFNVFVDSIFNAEYYVWYKKDGLGTDPQPPGKIGIEVDILSADNDQVVAQKTLKAINSKYFAVPDLRGLFLRGYDPDAIWNPTPEDRFSNNSAVFGSTTGAIELDDYLAHSHTYLYTNTSEAAAGADIATPNNFNAQTSVEGGFETRGVNMSVNYFIKY